MSKKTSWDMIEVCSRRTLSLAAVDNFMISCVVNIGLGSIGFGTIFIFDFSHAKNLYGDTHQGVVSDIYL